MTPLHTQLKDQWIEGNYEPLLRYLEKQGINVKATRDFLNWIEIHEEGLRKEGRYWKSDQYFAYMRRLGDHTREMMMHLHALEKQNA